MLKIPNNIPENSKFLEGIGDSAWFYIENVSEKESFEISRYTIEGILECRNIFQVQSTGFNIEKDYEFTYVSHCLKCSILQNGEKYTFIKKE